MVREDLEVALASFNGQTPFDHVVVDDFLDREVASSLAREFPSASDSCWHRYANALEQKSACNDWNRFGCVTYRTFAHLTGADFTSRLAQALNITGLVADAGLHGGGWHLHPWGGKLNPHLDYSLHPRLGMQRKLSLILYLNSDWRPEWGGQFGMWFDDGKSAGKLARIIEPLFNRAVLFDTTQQSWHGLAAPIAAPDSICRRSLAVSYLVPAAAEIDRRSRALFSPIQEQRGDSAIAALIQERAAEATAPASWRR